MSVHFGDKVPEKCLRCPALVNGASRLGSILQHLLENVTDEDAEARGPSVVAVENLANSYCDAANTVARELYLNCYFGPVTIDDENILACGSDSSIALFTSQNIKKTDPNS